MHSAIPVAFWYVAAGQSSGSPEFENIEDLELILVTSRLRDRSCEHQG